MLGCLNQNFKSFDFICRCLIYTAQFEVGMQETQNLDSLLKLDYIYDCKAKNCVHMMDFLAWYLCQGFIMQTALLTGNNECNAFRNECTHSSTCITWTVMIEKPSQWAQVHLLIFLSLLLPELFPGIDCKLCHFQTGIDSLSIMFIQG